MLKLSTLLKHKGTVVIGDSYYHFASKTMLRCVDSAAHAVCYNNPSELDEGTILHSFVPRKNKGVMPVDKYLPVVITLRSGEVQHRSQAHTANWLWDIGAQTIDTWVPDIDALIGLQNEEESEKSKHLQVAGIIQAIQDCKGKPIDIECSSFNYIARVTHSECYLEGEIHAVNHSAVTDDEWEIICTRAEFEKELENYNLNSPSPFRHPHHDLIVEWAKDMSKKYQFLLRSGEWEDCSDRGPEWDPQLEYRIKPRKFVKGHWYPCVNKESDRGSVKRFNGHYFFNETQHADLDKINYPATDFSFIGLSLGTDLFGK